MFRLIGTAVGAAVAVALVPALVNAPELLTMALAIWLGLCTYLSALDKSPRAYIFLLAGYTAGIVGFPSVARPGAVFDVAVLRGQEIGIGIVASALCHGLIFPQSVSRQLHLRTRRMMEDARRLSVGRITTGTNNENEHHHHTLVRDIAELETLATHLPYELTQSPIRVEMIRALQHHLMQVVAVSGAVADRLARIGPTTNSGLAGALDRAATWIAEPDTHAPPLELLRALEPATETIHDLDAALRLSLLDRLAELTVAHQRCSQIGDLLEVRPRSLPPDVQSELRSYRPRRHTDRDAAIRAAAATTLTVLACCTFWIATAWPNGQSAVVLASIMCALFSNLDDPTATGRKALNGVICGAGIAMLYDFAILPRITEFPDLMAVLAPVFIGIGLVSAMAGQAAFAVGLILVVPSLLMLDRQYDGDFITFANSAVAQIAGAWLSAVMLRLVRSVGVESRLAKLLAASGRRPIATSHPPVLDPLSPGPRSRSIGSDSSARSGVATARHATGPPS